MVGRRVENIEEIRADIKVHTNLRFLLKLGKFMSPTRYITVADLEPPPLFTQNLPSIVSKTQDLRLKICLFVCLFVCFFAILRVPPFQERPPPFRNIWIPHGIMK
jgi:hypothetical protein